MDRRVRRCQEDDDEAAGEYIDYHPLDIDGSTSNSSSSSSQQVSINTYAHELTYRYMGITLGYRASGEE